MISKQAGSEKWMGVRPMNSWGRISKCMHGRLEANTGSNALILTLHLGGRT